MRRRPERGARRDRDPLVAASFRQPDERWAHERGASRQRAPEALRRWWSPCNTPQCLRSRRRRSPRPRLAARLRSCSTPAATSTVVPKASEQCRPRARRACCPPAAPAAGDVGSRRDSPAPEGDSRAVSVPVQSSIELARSTARIVCSRPIASSARSIDPGVESRFIPRPQRKCGGRASVSRVRAAWFPRPLRRRGM